MVKNNFFIIISAPFLAMYAATVLAEVVDNADHIVSHVKDSIAKAQCEISKLPPAILRVPGLSSPKVRHLLNNLCSLPGGRYLEIGVWAGSTFIAALYGNDRALAEAIAIDNWSQFQLSEPKKAFVRNTSKFLSKNSFKFYEYDSFNLNKTEIFNPQKPINIYFYDGFHSVEAQKLAFVYYNDILANTFIAIVDDYGWDNVKLGTQLAFKELGYKILFEEYLPARFEGDRETWWNGIYVAVIRKP
jgi:hypothetical protein